MDIERLKELREEVFEDYKAYMVKSLKDEDGKVYPSTVPLDECSPIGKDLLKLIDEAIARQSVKSEDVQEAIDVLQAYEPTTRKNRTVDGVTEQYQPWIPVSEKLPEKSIDVLTYRKNGNSKVLRFENDCKWYDSYNEWETDVTHWKPLPEPPKGETT